MSARADVEGAAKEAIVMRTKGMWILILALPTVGCSARVQLENRSPGTVVVEEKSPRRASTSRAPTTRESAKRLGIPPGHLPPPGQCRIWYPGRPPGRQPAPGSCGRLARSLPAGAWLIESPKDEPGIVRVSECHHSKPDVIVAVRIYELDTAECVTDGGHYKDRDDDDQGEDEDEDR
jgi:hypothetical protein